jgi:hypothetical protein
MSKEVDFSWVLNGGSPPKKSKYNKAEDMIRIHMLNFFRKGEYFEIENASHAFDICKRIGLITEETTIKMLKTNFVLFRKVCKKLRMDGIPIIGIDAAMCKKFGLPLMGFCFTTKKEEVLKYCNVTEDKGKAIFANVKDAKKFLNGNSLETLAMIIMKIKGVKRKIG